MLFVQIQNNNFHPPILPDERFHEQNETVSDLLHAPSSTPVLGNDFDTPLVGRN